MLPTLHLASQSPRRKQLLESLGLPFVVTVAKDEERHPTAHAVADGVLQNAKAKATAILEKLASNKDVAIGADTLVVFKDEVLGKPKDERDATRMLRTLSGQVQTVYTGIYLVSRHYGSRGTVISSEVHFKKLSDSQIQAYAKTKEPYDKAGAYAVQGLGALFVDKVVGSYTNVVGLPIEALLTELESLTGISITEWFK